LRLATDGGPFCVCWAYLPRAPAASAALDLGDGLSRCMEAYLEHKRDEVDEVRLRPHPWEFALYLDA
jgi:hypothetical protein